MELIFSKDIRNIILSRLSSSSILAWASANKATRACLCKQFWLDLIVYRWGPLKGETDGYLKEYKKRYQDDLTELLSAAEKYDATGITNILAKGIEYDFNFLIRTLQLNDPNSLKFLIERVDLNFNRQNRYGETILFKISQLPRKGSHLSVLLSTNQINLNSTNQEGQTALICAVNSSQTDIARRLINAGADVNIQDDYGETALMNACRNGNSELVKYILKHSDAKLDLRNNKGTTAAMVAYANDNILDMLQREGADLNLVNSKDETVLMLCLKNRCYSSLSKLLNYDNIDVNTKDSTGKTILHHAILKRCSVQALTSILECKRIDINAKDKKNETALFKACNFGYIDLVKVLLQYKPNLKAGSSALLAAVSQGYVKIVKMLLHYDATDINRRNRFGDTSLILAVRKGNIDIVRELIKYKNVDLSAKDKRNFTAKQIALIDKSTEIARLLIEREAGIQQ